MALQKGAQGACREFKSHPGHSLSTQDTQLILNYALYHQKQGYRESTILARVHILKTLVKRGANLHDPESIKEVIANQNWSEGYKQNVVDAYQKLLELQGITWTKPFYKRVEKLPFIPSEKEIDALIARMNYCIAAFLRLLKETAIRPGEAWNLR